MPQAITAPRSAALPAVAEAGDAPQRWTLLHTALAGVLLTYAWRIQDLVPLLRQIQFVSLVSLAALGLFAVSGHVPRLALVSRHTIFRCAAFILLMMVLSVPFGVYPGQSFRFITEDHVKTFLVFAVLAASVRSIPHIERLLAVHVLGAIIYSGFILTHYQVGSDGRLAGLVYYDANDLAMMLVCTLPFTVYFLRPGSPGILRLLALAAVGIFMLTLVKTGSRGAFLGLVAVSGFMLVGFRAFSPGMRIGAITATFVVLFALSTDQYWSLMRTLLNPSEDYNWAGGSTSGRMEVWKRGVGYMIAYPATGVGASAFYAAEGRLSAVAKLQAYGRGLKWSAPHNSFVQVGAELGVPGLIAFLLLLRGAFRAGRVESPQGRGAAPRAPPSRKTALGQALMASIIGFCVSGFFLTQAYSAFLYTILALLIAFSFVEEPTVRSALAARGAPDRPACRLGRGGGWKDFEPAGLGVSPLAGGRAGAP